MAAYANVVLTDRASTPVNHTFVPNGFVGDVATFIESASSGIPQGASRLSVSVRKTPSGNYKVTEKIDVPISVVEVINGVSVSKVVDYDRVEVVYTFGKTSTTDRRKNLAGMTESAQKSTQTLINDLIVNLSPVY